MSEKTHGVAGFIHGIHGMTEFTGAATQGLAKASSDALVTEVRDLNGRRVTRRSDDQTDVISGNFRILASGFSRWEIASIFTVIGGPLAGDYIVVSSNETHNNGDFADYSVSAEKYEYLTPTP